MKLKHLCTMLALALAFVACEPDIVEIAVTKVNVTPATLTLSAGESKQLKAEVLPADATNATVTWKSSNESVATVASDGTVKAVNGGTATISAMAGGKTGSCSVTVTVNAASIELSESEIAFTTTGETKQLTATVKPDNASNKTITWNSSNKEVATVSDKGLVTSVGNGEATITATCGELKATCKVTVSVAATAIKLSHSELNFTSIGTTEKLTATIEPETAANKEVSWSSSNDKIAKVSDEGVVTSVGNGEATITATCGELKATCKVTVSVAATAIKLSHSELNFTSIGTTEKLTATIEPETAANKEVSWSSSNDKIAKVSDEGVVTSVGNGEATITAACGELLATCTVKVAVVATSIELSQSTISLTEVGQTVQLTATVKPDEAIDKSVVWDSSNDAAVTISQTGLITAVANGKATITATCGSLSATCEVDVTIAANIVEIEGDKASFDITGATADQIVDAIEKAIAAGATTFAFSGDYSALNLAEDTNVFSGAEIDVLDLSGVIGWPNYNGDPSVPSQAFYSTSGAFNGIKEVILPDAIKTINSYAFYKCTGLTKITAKGVTTINSNAFYNCTSLSEIDMPDVVSIGASAFFKTALTKVDFQKVSSVSASAFWMCTNLVEVNMPACKTIGAAGSGKTGAFSDCTSLTTVNMPNVEIIGDGSFAYCSALTSVDMPAATTVGAKAYISCKALVDIKLPKVTTIYEYAFNTCNAMATLVLTSPDTITIKSTSNSFGAYSNDTKEMDLTINANKQSEVGADVFDAPTWNGFTWKSISFVE